MKNITVITPYYKGKRTICDTINSVMNSFDKVKDEFKLKYIVIVDSIEDRSEACELLQKRYGKKIELIINEKNIGVAESRNKALKYTEFKFDYVLFLDQDDLIGIEYFSEISRSIKNNADMIVTNAYVVNTENNKKVKMYFKNPKLTFKEFLKGNKILTPGQVVFSKKISNIKDLYKGCSDEFKGADDWASYINIFIKYPNVKIDYIKKPVFYYNLHSDNYSNNWLELNMSAIKTAEFFRKSIDERHVRYINYRVEYLEFENNYKDSKYKFKIKDLGKLLKYYQYNVFNYNKLVHFINKKIIRFNS